MLGLVFSWSDRKSQNKCWPQVLVTIRGGWVAAFRELAGGLTEGFEAQQRQNLMVPAEENQTEKWIGQDPKGEARRLRQEDCQ